MPFRFPSRFLLAALLLTAAHPLFGEIRIEGSSTLFPLIRHAAQEYTRATGVPVTVIGGGGGKGVEAVREGRAQIGMVSRPLRPDEAPDLESYTVACDAIALLLHGGSPLKNLTSDQVRAIFTGKVRDFSQLEAPPMEILPVIKEKGRSTRTVFDRFFGLEETAPGAWTISTHVEAVALVASNPAAVGYASAAVVQRARKAGVELTTATLDGVAPTRENIASGRYPLVRKLNLVTRHAPSSEVLRFLDFLASAKGAALIEEHRLLDASCL